MPEKNLDRNIPKLEYEVYAIRNNFFGEKDHGFRTDRSQALIERTACKRVGEASIPCNMLRSGENVFLDDLTVGGRSQKLWEERIIIVDEGGEIRYLLVLDPVQNKNR